MTWEVEVSDEFREWYDALREDEWESVNSAVDLGTGSGSSLC